MSLKKTPYNDFILKPGIGSNIVSQTPTPLNELLIRSGSFNLDEPFKVEMSKKESEFLLNAI